ncbi:MAG: methylated-DNA--[protein]-cysteine S-methyltransferase [Actinomycetota bacterium]
MNSHPAEMTRYGHAETPIGPLLLVAREEGLAGIYPQEHRCGPVPTEGWIHDESYFDRARGQLGEYFSGDRTSFDLPLHPEGSPFQLEVWAGLREIPYGETSSYGELAQRIGRPGAARAVGSANARNPLSIVVPCHRVIGADGGLTGYAGGIDTKAWLLEHERRVHTAR